MLNEIQEIRNGLLKNDVHVKTNFEYQNLREDEI
jgi:hypothetical protein